MAQLFFERVLEVLQKEKVRYLVVGGVAVNLHGIPRFTADLDIMIDFDPDNLDCFIRAMKRLRYKPRVPVALEAFKDPVNRTKWQEEKNMRVFTLIDLRARYLHDLDVFINNPIGFEKCWKARKDIRVKRIRIHLISIPHLIILKKQAARDHDKSDIKALRQRLRLR